MNSLMHDNDESITGDIAGPLKNSIMDADKSATLLEELTQERMEGLIEAYYDLEDEVSAAVIKEASDIVLAADKLDALLFLLINQRMGNTFCGPAIYGTEKSLEAAWRSLPAKKDIIDQTWQTVMLPAIAAHKERGMRGCAPGARI